MSGLVQDADAVLEIGETTTSHVFADADAVVQVLSNLIENGIKYGTSRTEDHARVVVSARPVTEPIRSSRIPRPRLRRRHRLRTSRAHLRTLLPRRQSPLPGVRRHRPRSLHRPSHGSGPGRLHARRKRIERGQHLRLYPTPGTISRDLNSFRRFHPRVTLP